MLDHAEAALAGAGDGSDVVLVLGFESADHPLGPWLDRTAELCLDHGGRVEDRAMTEGDATGEAAGAGAQWRRTFLRAPYLRDALIRLGMVVETFETAVTWDRFADATERLADVARTNVAEVCGTGSVSMRVTHAYPDGAAPYFTVIAPGRPGEQVAMWDEIKAAVSDAILEVGATITHHHAVGRDHAPWYGQQAPAPFLAALRAVKRELDPAAIMNPGVLGL
jgi:alkyldihydroxyacetonephosphate synthase